MDITAFICAKPDVVAALRHRQPLSPFAAFGVKNTRKFPSMNSPTPMPPADRLRDKLPDRYSHTGRNALLLGVALFGCVAYRGAK